MSGAIATLSIDLVARLASLEAGLDKAGRLAEKSTQQIAAKFDGLKAVALGVGAAFGTALSVTALNAFFRATVDGLDKLNDLSDATGASIENLSALEDVAARTGTSFDTVGTAIVKMNKLLADAKPGSEAANVLAAIGLSAEELKKKDPGDALQAIALQLAKFADDDHGQKARIVMELFGKSVREVAPLLKDLAERGQLNATVTAEQAKAAEAFNQQIFALQKNITDAARALTSDLLPALNLYLKATGSIKALSGVGFLGLTAEVLKGNTFREAADGVVFYTSKLDALQKQRAAIASSGNPIAVRGGLLDVDAEIAKVEKLQAFYRQLANIQAPDNGQSDPRELARRGRGPATLPNVGSVFDPEAAKKRLDEYLKLVDAMAAGDEQAAKDAAEAWKAWEAIQLADHKTNTDAWALQWKQVFDEIDAEQERAIEEGAALIAQEVEQISEFSKEAARNIQDALGDSLYDALDGKFSDIGKLWLNLVKRMAAQAASAKLNEQLFGKDFGSTGNVGGALGGLLQWFKGLGGTSSGGSGLEFDIGTWDGSHAAGLNYVPFDGYRAILHKGERVQTSAQARADDGGRAAQMQQPIVINFNAQGDITPNTVKYVRSQIALVLAQQAGGRG